MSNSIWHDRYVELPEDVFANSVRPCVVAVDENKKFIGANYGLKGSIPEIKYWAKVDDLIAQADKAERLEEENEAMREEFEVWHGNHKCVLEDLEIAQRALEYYADSRFGKKQDDGTYALEIDKGCGVTVVYTYDPRLAKHTLEQIKHKE